MKLCINCHEVEVTSGPRCKDCKNALSLGISPSNINHKWRVAIETCKEGHRFVPVNNACLICEPTAISKAIRCSHCKKSFTSRGNIKKYCSRKCAYEEQKNRLTDKYCLNCGEQLKIHQDRVCSIQCNGQYKHKKALNVLHTIHQEN